MSKAPSACVTLNEITKSYGSTPVIRNLSLTLMAEATTAIVGESGSGKSTLLQLINGLIKPDTGRVQLYGRGLDYADLPRERKQMGYAVQGAGLFPHLTVRQNVCLMAELAGWSSEKIETRYVYLFRLMELPLDFSERFPHSLSGGQQQRVSLCRAMMLKPRLLLLDEPFSALDPITKHAIYEEFIQLRAEENPSIVLITHDMHEAKILADYLVIIRDGIIVQADRFETVRRAPVDDYVARFFAVQGLAA